MNLFHLLGKTLRVLEHALCAILLITSGCHLAAKAAKKPELHSMNAVTFDSLQMVLNADTRGIAVGGIEEYIARYGREGWVAGLSDDRPAVMAVRGFDTEAVRASGILEDSTELRVKDVFCWYYRKLNGLSLQPAVAWDRTVRDAAIEDVINSMDR